MALITSRRTFITGLGALLVAPTIVRASSIMPVRPIAPSSWSVVRGPWVAVWDCVLTDAEVGQVVYGISPTEIRPDRLVFASPNGIAEKATHFATGIGDSVGYCATWPSR